MRKSSANDLQRVEVALTALIAARLGHHVLSVGGLLTPADEVPRFHDCGSPDAGWHIEPAAAQVAKNRPSVPNIFSSSAASSYCIELFSASTKLHVECAWTRA